MIGHHSHHTTTTAATTTSPSVPQCSGALEPRLVICLTTAVTPGHPTHPPPALTPCWAAPTTLAPCPSLQDNKAARHCGVWSGLAERATYQASLSHAAGQHTPSLVSNWSLHRRAASRHPTPHTPTSSPPPSPCVSPAWSGRGSCRLHSPSGTSFASERPTRPTVLAWGLEAGGLPPSVLVLYLTLPQSVTPAAPAAAGEPAGNCLKLRRTKICNLIGLGWQRQWQRRRQRQGGHCKVEERQDLDMKHLPYTVCLFVAAGSTAAIAAATAAAGPQVLTCCPAFVSFCSVSLRSCGRAVRVWLSPCQPVSRSSRVTLTQAKLDCKLLGVFKSISNASND
ncbi:hypothetical protein E2C01_028298 [Portunus trituberculatus]|uniref:Uncharacterized protein n=1 Tax=Portunus trituberculatus TaxID=210409 RepID=A0A5B7ER99_PORTR|nr:hypothetical protein [Portunus trituberculatus]